MIQTMNVFLYGTRLGVIRLEESGYCAFQYYPEFCATGLQPSPLLMPAVPDRIYRFPNLSRETYNGLPGMIADALPDSFGQALLNKWLAAQGRMDGQANCIEKLSFQGKRAMGALEFVPAREPYLEESSPIELQSLIDTARYALESKENFQTSLNDKHQAVLDILKIGTSAGGQRAKAVIAIHPETKEIRSGQVPAPDGFEYWLIKFDGFDSNGNPIDPANFGRREFAFHKCVLDAGIDMATCAILNESGRAHFMTKRFDRPGGNKIHMQTLCGLAHFDFRMPGAYSYEQAFAVLRRLNLDYQAGKELYRRMVFNIFCLNMDDHTKNISFLMDNNGRWKLSPAYDMGFSYNPNGQWANAHQMTINGKRDDFTHKDLIEFASKQDISNPEEIIQQVMDAVYHFPEYAKTHDVPDEEIQTIMKMIDNKTKGLGK